MKNICGCPDNAPHLSSCPCNCGCSWHGHKETCPHFPKLKPPVTYKLELTLSAPEDAEKFCGCPRCKEHIGDLLRTMVQSNLRELFKKSDPFRMFPEEISVEVKGLNFRNANHPWEKP